MRSEEVIKKEYVDLCTRAGELQYQLEQLKAGLHEINNRILSVNKEFVELKQSQKEEPKETSDVASQAQTD